MTVSTAQPQLTQAPEGRPLTSLARAEIALRRADVSEWTRRNQWLNGQDEDSRDEYLNGRAIPRMPARANHRRPVDTLKAAANAWAKSRGLGEAAGESAMIRLADGDVYPDVLFWPAEVARTITGDVTIYPTPTFVVEVLSADSEYRDRVEKFAAYARHGIEEYWIVDPEARVVECYLLSASGHYELRERVTGGSITSVAIEGFAIDHADLFELVDAGSR